MRDMFKCDVGAKSQKIVTSFCVSAVRGCHVCKLDSCNREKPSRMLAMQTTLQLHAVLTLDTRSNNYNCSTRALLETLLV